MENIVVIGFLPIKKDLLTCYDWRCTRRTVQCTVQRNSRRIVQK